MKIVNIFGLVVAVHVVVLLLIFAIPGCRTTSKSPDAAIAAMPMEPEHTSSSPIQPAPAMTAADLNPPLAGSSSASTGQIPTIQSPVGGTRSSPTRPGTPVASALQPAPVTDVTPVRTYTVVRGDNLWTIAKRHGVSVRELAAANNLGDKSVLQVNQKLKIPAGGGSESTTTSSSPAASQASEGVTYTIRPGDTLGAIARRHGTTVAALKAMNNLRSDLVRVGDTLTIPETGAAASTPPAAASTAAPAPSTAPSPALARGAGGAMKHVVAPGETLGAIARRYGVKLGELALANNIADPARIRPGQELTIPGWQAPAGASASRSVPTQYPDSFQPASEDETPTISTGDTDDVPVIQVEESVPTLTVEPAPVGGGGGGGGDQPPLFN